MKPTLRTARLTLRPMALEDDVALARILGDPRRPDYLGERHDDPAFHRDRIATRLADGANDDPLGVWMADQRSDGTAIGLGLLKPLEDTGEIEVGWHLDPDAWGHGYATEIGAALVEHGFAIGLERIVAVIHPDNGASRRVTEKLEMAPDGTGDHYGQTLDRFVLAPPGTRTSDLGS